VRLAQAEAGKGKTQLDKLKAKGEDLMRTNPKSDRLQPYKAQYMRLCKLYVDAMKDHQKAKVRDPIWTRFATRLETRLETRAPASGGRRSRRRYC
jgi:hypothetical protein